MSHTATCNTVPMANVSALRQTVRDLNARGIACSLLENAKPRMYYRNQLSKHLGLKTDVCDYVLRLEGSRYDVAFVKQEDGSYLPAFDNHMNEIGKRLGVPVDAKLAKELGVGREPFAIAKLLQSYSRNVSINEAVDLGYLLDTEQVNEAGEMEAYVLID